MEYQYFKGRELSVELLVRDEPSVKGTLNFLEFILSNELHRFPRGYRIVLVNELVERMIKEGKIRPNDPRYQLIDDFCRINLNHPAPIYVADDVLLLISTN